MDNDVDKQKRKISLKAVVLLIFLHKQRDKNIVTAGQPPGYCTNFSLPIFRRFSGTIWPMNM